jgi:hypothetical protein
VDHLLRLLPSLLAEDGSALVMQLSIVSQLQTEELLDELGLKSRVVDFSFSPFTSVVEQNLAQIERVEQLSDAYDLTLGGDRVMVAYLLEIARR